MPLQTGTILKALNGGVFKPQTLKEMDNVSPSHCTKVSTKMLKSTNALGGVISKFYTFLMNSYLQCGV